MHKHWAIVLLLTTCSAQAETVSEDAFRAAATWTVQVRTAVRRPFIEDEQGSWFGSGLVVDAARGWVLTNAHVAGYSGGSVTIAFQNRNPIAARRIYVDPHLDLALLAYDPARLPFKVGEPSLDCSGTPSVGHAVGAFGHPWGFRFTGTRGIISAVTSRLGPNMLQTDAPINEGNSGGPLISLESGKVVGVNTAKVMDQAVEGLSFAVPMPYACTVIELLRQGRDPSPPSHLVDFAIDENEEQTLVVARSRLPAGTLDLRVGDEILAVGSPAREVQTESDLMDALRGRLDALSLAVLRGGEQVNLQGRWPAASRILEREGLWISGALFAEAESTTAGQIAGTPALMVHHVEPGSDAEAAALLSYDLPVSVNGQAVESLAALARFANAARIAHEPLRLTVLRWASETSAQLFVYAVLELPVTGVEALGPGTPGAGSR